MGSVACCAEQRKKEEKQKDINSEEDRERKELEEKDKKHMQYMNSRKKGLFKDDLGLLPKESESNKYTPRGGKAKPPTVSNTKYNQNPKTQAESQRPKSNLTEEMIGKIPEIDSSTKIMEMTRGGDEETGSTRDERVRDDMTTVFSCLRDQIFVKFKEYTTISNIGSPVPLKAPCLVSNYPGSMNKILVFLQDTDSLASFVFPENMNTQMVCSSYKAFEIQLPNDYIEHYIQKLQKFLYEKASAGYEILGILNDISDPFLYTFYFLKRENISSQFEPDVIHLHLIPGSTGISQMEETLNLIRVKQNGVFRGAIPLYDDSFSEVLKYVLIFEERNEAQMMNYLLQVIADLDMNMIEEELTNLITTEQIFGGTKFLGTIMTNSAHTSYLVFSIDTTKY